MTVTAAGRSLHDEFAAWYSTDPELVADPYPFFHRLRRESPVHRQAGLVVLSRYADCAAAAIEPRLEKTDGKRYDYGALDREALPERSQQQLDELFHMERLALNKTEGEEHARLRGLVQKAFTPRMIEKLERRIVEICAELLDAAAGKERIDAIDDLAYQLPLVVISEMLEVPSEDRYRIREWGLGMGGLVGGVRDDVTRVVDDAHRNRKEMFAYMRGIVERRRASRGRAESVMSLLLDAGADGRIADEQLIAVLVQFIFAGHETTTNAIGNAIVALMHHRDQWERLCADLTLARSAADEALRYGSPVQTEPRYVTTDVVLAGGIALEQGERVRILWAAANRDPERFPEPDRFDVARPDNKHLALGIGRHYCLGSALARAEIATAVGTLARRFPDMRMPELPRWRRSFNIRGVVSLPLVLGPDRG